MNFTKIITAIDAHTEGNPERVVTGGVPLIPGKTMLEKSWYARENLDYLRTMLVHDMLEEKGKGKQPECSRP